MQQGRAAPETAEGRRRENELDDRAQQHDERHQPAAAGAPARDPEPEGDQPEAAGRQPRAAGALLLPGRRPAEGQEAVPGVAALRPLHRHRHVEGGGHLHDEAEGAGGQPGHRAAGELRAEGDHPHAGRGEERSRVQELHRQPVQFDQPERGHRYRQGRGGREQHVQHGERREPRPPQSQPHTQAQHGEQ